MRIKFIKLTFPIFLLALLLSACGLNPPAEKLELPEVTLNYWQVWQDSFDIKPVIEAYQKKYPQVTINFRKLKLEEYETEMLKALAEDRGPDIFSIPADWLGMYQKNVIEPMPETAQIDQIVMRQPRAGELESKLDKIVKITHQLLTPRDIKSNYIKAARQAVLRDLTVKNEVGENETREAILGLPLSVDVLSLYYNKELLEQAEIFDAPKTWEEFQKDVIKLTRQDEQGEFIQNGAALGSAENIPRAFDVLSLLMLQTGAEMINQEGTYAMFDKSIREDGYNAGLAALRFYTDFANPAKEVYSWNEKQGPAIDAFKQGKLAFLFGYSYHLNQIKGSKVDFAVAPVPQPVGSPQVMSYLNFWVETVSKKSLHKDYAWDFIVFASQPENLQLLLKQGQGFAPTKALLAQPPANAELAVFQSQVEQAGFWYTGKNAIEAEAAVKAMITAVNSGDQTLEEALRFGAQRVSQTLR